MYSKEDEDITTNVSTFDINEYPLLNSLGATPLSLDRLIQEILRYKKNKAIHFTRGNNREGVWIPIPSYRKLERYDLELSKKDSLIEDIIDVISKNFNSTKGDTAVYYLLRVEKRQPSFANTTSRCRKTI